MLQFLKLLIYILIAFIVFIPNEERLHELIEKSPNEDVLINKKERNYNAVHDETASDLEEVLLPRKSLKASQNATYAEIKAANLEYSLINKELLKKINYQVQNMDNNSIEEQDKIIFGRSTGYSLVEGITCFRGNVYRDSASYGYAGITEKNLEILWNIPIGRIDEWSGVGWNGQSAIVEWSDDIKDKMNINEIKKDKKHLKEVIYGALDGKVYFLDLEDGEYTRNPIIVPGSIKGSVSVDPRGIPLLYVGQGINKVNGIKVEIGFRIYSLIDQSKLCFINGVDSFAYRGWGAFDSNALIDRRTDTLLLCGENGIFYRVKLNTCYNEEDTMIHIDPQIIKYRYKIEGNEYQGIENSVAVFRNLAYFADNGGWLQCIDINTLEPVWICNVNDDTDSTIVIEEEQDNEVCLYTACEVDKQGTKGICFIRKFDALSGQQIWEKAYECQSKIGNKPNNGGALATPVVGKNNLSSSVIFNLARYGGFNKGALISLNKKTGEEIWRFEMNNYSWSSPVAVYTEEGEGYIIVCNSAGMMYLIEGLSGEVLDKISLGSNVEGSPAVFDDIIVVGTRGQKIFGIKIK